MYLTVQRKKQIFYEVIFVAPTMFFFIIVKILPMLATVWYSLTSWNGISAVKDFVGIQNFIRLAEDKHYWYSLGFTLFFSLFSVIFANVLGFLVAYVLSKDIPGRNFLRAAFYLPYVLGGLVLGFVWKFIFLKFFPLLFQLTGISIFGLCWLGTTGTAFWAMVIVQTWSILGYMMLLYVAGISVIPVDVVESAKIDGASSIQIIFGIVLPLLMPTITRCLFISFLTCMKVYDVNLSLTDGNPYRSSESIAYNIYRTAFGENAMGYGCAKSLIFIMVILIISFIQIEMTSRKEVQM